MTLVRMDDAGIVLTVYRPAKDEAPVIGRFDVEDAERWRAYRVEYGVEWMNTYELLAWLRRSDWLERDLAAAENAEDARALSVGEDWS